MFAQEYSELVLKRVFNGHVTSGHGLIHCCQKARHTACVSTDFERTDGWRAHDNLYLVLFDIQTHPESLSLSLLQMRTEEAPEE